MADVTRRTDTERSGSTPGDRLENVQPDEVRSPTSESGPAQSAIARTLAEIAELETPVTHRVVGGYVPGVGFLKSGAAALALALGLTPPTASAQVAISVGVQEVYDDNIYLEDDGGVPPPIVIDDQITDPTFVLDPPKQVDGDPNEDFLTNLYVSLSGGIPISPHVKTSAEGKVGAIIFGRESEESRFTLDTFLRMQTEETLLPKPFSAALQSKIESRANDVTDAKGTATEQSQQHIGSFDFGATNVEVANKTHFGATYQFAYTSFLGDFVIDDNDSDLNEFEDRVSDEGSDYFTNTVNANLDYDVTNAWTAGLYTGYSIYSFTHVESNDLIEADSGELDRSEFVGGVKTGYQPSKEFVFNANAGFNLSTYKEDRDPQSVTVVNADGTTTQVLIEPDDDEIGMEFAVDGAWIPDPTRSITARVDQRFTTDIDGDRIFTRSVALNGMQMFGDRFRFNLGGLFLQYNIGDSLSEPTQRFETTVAGSYALTQSISLNIGWNYTNQNADEANELDAVFLDSEDYESHRFFIGIDAGLVGTTKG